MSESNIKDTILARACKPAKEVKKVIAVRLTEETFAILSEQALQAGIRPGDIVRAAIDQFCSEV